MRWLILILIVCGCSPNSLEEFQSEGESIIQALTRDLERVESPDDLRIESTRLKKKFGQLTDLMVRARKYQLKHPDEESEREPNLDISNALKAEFVRIYRIEGCQEIMEEVQRESLYRINLEKI